MLKNNPMYRFLILLTVSCTVGLQAWRTLLNNFAVEVVGLEGYHIGIVQSAREIPGFLSLLVVVVIMFIREYRLSAFSVFMLGVGVAATGLFPTYYGIIITTMVMSFGFHYFETTNQSLTLQYFDKETAPLVFGKQRSYAAASNIVVGVSIYYLSRFLEYDNIFLMIGTVVLFAGIWGLMQNPVDKSLTPQRKKMVFRKEYWLFYFLSFIAGSRRQIFIAFAVFLLVKKFEYTIQEVAALFIINNVFHYFLSPLIGKAIVHYGERKVLSLEYFSLTFIFAAYALTDSKIIVGVLYVLDHIFYNFAIAIRTYFQKVGDPGDIAPSMAVGFTINHIGAVVIPAIGGMLWMLDYRIPFFCGAGMSLISLFVVQMIDTSRKVYVPEEKNIPLEEI